MKIYICDNKNCKKQLNKEEINRVKINNTKYDLCERCAQILNKFINNGFSSNNQNNTTNHKSEEQPVKTEEQTVKTEEQTVKTEEQPVKTEEQTVKTEEQPVKTEEQTVKRINVDKKIKEIGLEEILTRINKGESLDSIANSINIPRSSLSNWMKINNIQRNTTGKRKAALLVDSYGIEKIRDNYLNRGYTTSKLAEEIGISASYLTLVLSRNNIRKRSFKNANNKPEIIEKDQENTLSNDNKKSIFKNTENSKKKSRKTISKPFNIGSKVLGEKQIKLLSDCEEKAKVSAACRNCLYRELEINHCWYKMVTNKDNYIHEEICNHFVDRNKHEEKLKEIK